MADWIRVSEAELDAHLNMLRETEPVRKRHFPRDDVTVYYQGDGDVFDHQWVGKVAYYHEKPVYYIADLK